MKELQKRGIYTQVHYIPLFFQPYYRIKSFKEFEGSLKYYEQTLSLPLFPLMNIKDVDYVVDNIKEVLID